MSLINSNSKNRPIWLAKVPKYLGEAILKTNKNVIGEININSDLSMNVELFIKDLHIPEKYSISLKPKDSKMIILNNSDIENMEIIGSITDEIFFQPVINKEYLLYKKSLKNAQKNLEKQTKVINYYSETLKGDKYNIFKEMNQQAKKRKLELQDKKRERLDKKDIMDIVFNAFEKHDYWTVKDLADFSGQPLAYIQEIISEICVLNKKDHRNTYELKPEYK